MEDMKTASLELVFIPAPAVGHITSMVEIAKLLINRDEQLSITVVITKFPFESALSTYIQSLMSSPAERMHFIELPEEHNPHLAESKNIYNLFVESQKKFVKDALAQNVEGPREIAGFVIDMFCTTMMDVSNELGVPTYVVVPSSASFIDMMLHFQDLRDHNDNMDFGEFKDSDTELALPSFSKGVPVKVLPSEFLDKGDVAASFMEHARRIRKTKGIMINSFSELEHRAINSFSSVDRTSTIPPIYPVGPILDLEKKGAQADSNDQKSGIMMWLDQQPPSSVVFLCFGSRGSFEQEQVKEMAHGLESSGHRFLWSLRRPPPKGKFDFPKEYANPEEVLPEGFLTRTVEIGKVIGWAPQVAVLAHPALGGFVSHCGWNSILESLWFGVPIATWPMYAEQQFNAFQLVKELKLAVEIKVDYRRDMNMESDTIISAKEIVRGIRCVMEQDSEVRIRVKEVKKKSRRALEDGGSSHASLRHFIEAVVENTPRP